MNFDMEDTRGPVQKHEEARSNLELEEFKKPIQKHKNMHKTSDGNQGNLW